MKRINVNLRALELERENAGLKAENERIRADIDYIAMMTEVEIDEEGSDEPEI